MQRYINYFKEGAFRTQARHYVRTVYHDAEHDGSCMDGIERDLFKVYRVDAYPRAWIVVHPNHRFVRVMSLVGCEEGMRYMYFLCDLDTDLPAPFVDLPLIRCDEDVLCDEQ